MRKKRSKPCQTKPTYAVVVDGETEQWYIHVLKQNNSHLEGIRLYPTIPQRKKLEDQYQEVLSNVKDSDKVIWIIDYDVIDKERREARKGTKTAHAKLKEYIHTLKENYADKVVVIVNNPCLEFWFLLHFEGTNKYYRTYNNLISQLKKHLPNYEKKRSYYINKAEDIYVRLLDFLPSAIENSRRNPDFDFEEPHVGIAQMYKLFDCLKITPNLLNEGKPK